MRLTCVLRASNVWQMTSLVCTTRPSPGPNRSPNSYCIRLTLLAPYPSLVYIAQPILFCCICRALSVPCGHAGDLSRNRTVGLRLGKGEALEDIIASMKAVAEGVLTSRSAHLLAQKVSYRSMRMHGLLKLKLEKQCSLLAPPGML